MDKKLGRMKRALKIRSQIKRLQKPRLCIYRTPKHIYAQVILPSGKVIAVASTLDHAVKQECSYGGNVAAAIVVGKYIAQRSKQAGIVAVAFDRSGFRYHGRVLSLANAAREHGLEF